MFAVPGLVTASVDSDRIKVGEEHERQPPFRGKSAHEFIGESLEALRREVGELPPKDAIGGDRDAWLEHLSARFEVDIPVLREEGITVHRSEETVPLRGIEARIWGPYGGGTAKVERLTIEVPVDGDPQLLLLRPSSLTYTNGMLLRGAVLVFMQQDREVDPAKMREEFDRQMTVVRTNVVNLTKELEGYNEQVRIAAAAQFDARRKQLIEGDQRLERLGFPLKQRDDAPKSLASSVRRKIVPRPTAGPGAKPDPELLMAHYEEILTVWSSMALVMERVRRPSQTWAKRAYVHISWCN